MRIGATRNEYHQFEDAPLPGDHLSGFGVPLVEIRASSLAETAVIAEASGNEDVLKTEVTRLSRDMIEAIDRGELFIEGPVGDSYALYIAEGVTEYLGSTIKDHLAEVTDESMREAWQRRALVEQGFHDATSRLVDELVEVRTQMENVEYETSHYVASENVRKDMLREFVPEDPERAAAFYAILAMTRDDIITPERWAIEREAGQIMKREGMATTAETETLGPDSAEVPTATLQMSALQVAQALR